MATFIHHGLDELVMAQGLTSFAPMPRSVLESAFKDALAELNLSDCKRVRSAGTSTRKARSDVYRVGHVDVWLERVTAQLHRVVGYVRQEYLHLDQHAAYVEVHDLLVKLGRVLVEREGFALESDVPFLSAITVFCDVTGWPFSRRMIRRFKSLVGKGFKDWGEGGTEFQGIQHAKFMKVYLKTAQIKRRRSAAYVREVWAQRSGFTSKDEAVWRIEFSWPCERLRKFGEVDPNALWQESLRLVRLTARNPDDEDRPLADRADARIWKDLGRLKFDAPWDREPIPRPAIRLPEAAIQRQAFGSVAWGIAMLVDDPTLPDDEILDEAKTVFACLTLDDDFRSRLLASARRRIHQPTVPVDVQGEDDQDDDSESEVTAEEHAVVPC